MLEMNGLGPKHFIHALNNWYIAFDIIIRTGPFYPVVVLPHFYNFELNYYASIPFLITKDDKCIKNSLMIKVQGINCLKWCGL